MKNRIFYSLILALKIQKKIFAIDWHGKISKSLLQVKLVRELGGVIGFYLVFISLMKYQPHKALKCKYFQERKMANI